MQLTSEILRRQRIIELMAQKGATAIRYAAHPDKPMVYRVYGISLQGQLIWTNGAVIRNRHPTTILMQGVADEATATALQEDLKNLEPKLFRERASQAAESVAKRLAEMKANPQPVPATTEAENLAELRKVPYTPGAMHTITIKPPVYSFHVEWKTPGADGQWYRLEFEDPSFSGVLDRVFAGRDTAALTDEAVRGNHGLEMVSEDSLLLSVKASCRGSGRKVYQDVLAAVKHPRVIALLQADYAEWEASGFAPVKLITDAVTEVPAPPALAAVPDVSGAAERATTLSDTPTSKADLRVVPEMLPPEASAAAASEAAVS